ncbi:hypothetical protein DMC47_21430 [Nostoc sp. 3335mG]|nr:hypothetical protein DMC47_21430 [Nostoc sp. 3335mG]
MSFSPWTLPEHLKFLKKGKPPKSPFIPAQFLFPRITHLSYGNKRRRSSRFHLFKRSCDPTDKSFRGKCDYLNSEADKLTIVYGREVFFDPLPRMREQFGVSRPEGE